MTGGCESLDSLGWERAASQNFVVQLWMKLARFPWDVRRETEVKAALGRIRVDASGYR